MISKFDDAISYSNTPALRGSGEAGGSILQHSNTPWPRPGIVNLFFDMEIRGNSVPFFKIHFTSCQGGPVLHLLVCLFIGEILFRDLSREKFVESGLAKGIPQLIPGLVPYLVHCACMAPCA